MAHLMLAAQNYLSICYPAGTPATVEVPAFEAHPADRAIDLVRRTFRDESHTVGELCCKRHTLRLGNHRYPHMKLVLQEFSEHGLFYFTVDAHDQLPTSPGMPGYDAWMRLQDHNAYLKEQVEARFRYLGLPTLSGLLDAIQEQERRTEATRSSDSVDLTVDDSAACILVVDDDEYYGGLTEAILRGEGYRVERAWDGREALAYLADHPAPDLVVLDYLMPRLCGGDVCAAIRSDTRLTRLPILLATTTPPELIGSHQADGFLVKPYHRKVLTNLVAHLLTHPRPEPAPASASHTQLL